MKKYKFELEKVLEIRENIERQRQAELAKIRYTLRQNVENLKNLNSTKERIQQEFLDTQIKRPNVGEYIQYYEYLCLLKRKINKQTQLIEEIKREEEKKRKLLEDASKDKLVIEELKKQDYNRFLNEINRLEQKLVDEMATISYNLKRNDKE